MSQDARISGRAALQKSWADGQLDFATTCFHALEGLREIGQADFFGDKVLRGDVTTAYRFERFANEARGVVEW